MNRFPINFIGILVAVAIFAASAARADTIYLENGRTIEGEVTSRGPDSVRVKTKTGTLALPFARVLPAETGALDKARAALEGGDAPTAERHASIILFWEPDNAAATEILRSVRALVARESAREAYEKILAAYQIAVAGEVHPVDRMHMLAKLEPTLEKLAGDEAGAKAGANAGASAGANAGSGAGPPVSTNADLHGADYARLLRGIRSARERNHLEVHGRPVRDERFKNLESLEDPRAVAYLAKAMALARETYGEPRIPIKKVHLTREKRLKQKTRGDRAKGGLAGYTYFVDSELGEFGINMGIGPDSFKFYKTLGHETLHTFNSRLTSVYMEGLCEVFAHKLLAREKEMRTFYSGPASKDKDYRPVYARAFLMMDEVDKVAGPGYMRTFLRHVEYIDSIKVSMRLDIDGWLASMDETTREDVRAVILRHAPAIKQAQSQQFGHLTFPLPD